MADSRNHRRAKSNEIVQPRAEYAIDVGGGRQLGVAEFGHPKGKPFLWFHGTPGARRQVPPNARAYAEKKGLRIFGVERPGVGWSTPHLYGAFVDWAKDIEVLADEIGLKRFGVIGLSGGGPYTLACAHQLPDRVVGGAVLGGVAPTLGRDAAAGGLVKAAASLRGAFEVLRYPLGVGFTTFVQVLEPFTDPVFDLVLNAFPEGDRRVLGRPEMRKMFVDDLTTGSKTGLHSVVADVILFSRPWGFLLRDIEVPVHFWQGDSDPLVPFSHGAHQAALVPNSTLTLRPGEGHLGGLDQAEKAIDAILQHWPRERAGKKKTPARRTRRR